MFQYFALYKPYEVLSQFSPEKNKRTLKDCIQVPSDVYPVGRLDYDSEGLLILTNDPTINAAILHPSNAHERSYLVQVDGQITNDAVARLGKGVIINVDGKSYKTRPARVQLLEAPPEVPERYPPIRFRKNIPTSWIKLTLKEGKNRQVRKMTAATGFPTLRLIRMSIGKLDITGWQPGEIRQFSKQELLSWL
jgi:23S rRNA pseudouridine2457 synthase